MSQLRNSKQSDKQTRNYYWNKIFISQEEFKSYTSHLDIIFFRSRRSSASLHRLMMRSHFDHVGLLFKDENDCVFVL